MDCSPPDSSVHRIFQAGILAWVAISSVGDLSDPGVKPLFLHGQADSIQLSPREAPGSPDLSFNHKAVLWDSCFNSFDLSLEDVLFWGRLLISVFLLVFSSFL